jgi:thioredoxin
MTGITVVSPKYYDICKFMKLHFSLLFFSAGIYMAACSQKPSDSTAGTNEVQNLKTAAFEEKLKSTPSRIVLDVRTPEEFKEGHLEGAVNMDINNTDFDQNIGRLDTALPVFVYCLAGGRSSRAAEKLQSMGFPAVYNMEGGMSRWTYENRATVTPEGNSSKGMKLEAFQSMVNSVKDTLVLVDFWAKWCAPCKKIMAYMPQIENEYAGKIKVVKVNYDDNPALVKQLGLDNVPYLFIYKNGTQIWKQSGFLEASALKEAIKKQF